MATLHRFRLYDHFPTWSGTQGEGGDVQLLVIANKGRRGYFWRRKFKPTHKRTQIGSVRHDSLSAHRSEESLIALPVAPSKLSRTLYQARGSLVRVVVS